MDINTGVAFHGCRASRPSNPVPPLAPRRPAVVRLSRHRLSTLASRVHNSDTNEAGRPTLSIGVQSLAHKAKETFVQSKAVCGLTRAIGTLNFSIDNPDSCPFGAVQP
ncbi:hypothetical protein EMIT0158MI4_300024 [Burkholderia ambifaria]